MIFSILVFVTLLVSTCIKERKKSLGVQTLSCFLEAIYDFIISAYTGAMLSILNCIRTFLFINKEKFTKATYLLILFLFEGIILVNCYTTWAGWISILPTVGSIIRTFCLWQSDMKLVRISSITTGLLYGLYYIYYNSWFMVLGDLFLMFTGMYAVWKNDMKKEKYAN